jgi:hypothetical protein
MSKIIDAEDILGEARGWRRVYMDGGGDLIARRGRSDS